MLRFQSFFPTTRLMRSILALFLVGVSVGWPVAASAASLSSAPWYNGYHNKSYPNQRCTTYYYVHRGDTLSKIAARYGVNVYAVAQANGIANINRIYAGQYLCIPAYHYGYHDYGYDHDGYGKDHDADHDDKWTVGYKHAAASDYGSAPATTSGYYVSSGGYTGVCYYGDPRYATADQYSTGQSMAQSCYQDYPQSARYP